MPLKINKTNKTLDHISHVKINNSIEARQEELNGEAYTVYPVVMLTVGVHSGSNGPTFYSEEELMTFPGAWNGVPVTLEHPDLNGTPVSANSPDIYRTQVLGRVFNTQYVNGKLKAEIWLNNRYIDQLAPGMKAQLLRGERLEVSTGLFDNGIEEEGSFNGEIYNAVAQHIRPDHLALLPGGVGACSWQDGCGVRVNEKGEGMVKNKKKQQQEKEQDFLISNSLITNEIDYTELVNMLSQKIDSMDVRGEKVNFLRRVYEDYVVYKVSYMEQDRPSQYFKRNYQVKDDGIEWSSDPVRVRENVSYEEITDNSKGEQNMAKTMKECCPDKVEELIKNNEHFTEDDREVLLGMSEDAFALTINKAKPIEKKEKVVDNKEEPKKEVATMEELLANASPELREGIQYGQSLLRERKAELVETIKANENCAFSDEELNSFDIEFLGKLASTAKAASRNYTANAGATNVTTNAPEPLPFDDWEKEDK